MKKITLRKTLEFLAEDYKRVSRKKNGHIGSFLYKCLTNAGFRAVFLYRIGRWLKLNNFSFLAGMCQRLMHHFAHCWINVNANIGAGFLITHVGGLVIGGATTLGKNCDVRQNITFGGNYSKKAEDGRQQPIVGDNVSFGAGCVVIGPVTIGSNSIIGANSVVTKDVPEGVIVSGIPAVVIRKVWSSEDSERKL